MIQNVISLTILLATLFTAFSPRLFSGDFGSVVQALMTPQPVSNGAADSDRQAVRIGIVAGHWGNGADQGAVCDNGTTEVSLNYDIAYLAAQILEGQGYTVDLLQEFDPRLTNYRAAVLVSVHNDSCADYGPTATGYKVSPALGNRDPNLSSRLVACLYDRYGRATGLPFHPGSITRDMTEYHAFDELDPATTAAIIETGFMRLDYEFLTTQTGKVARGIADGILCFLKNESTNPLPAP